MSRTYTRDEVQAVVNGMVGHPDCRANGAAYDVGWDRCAREVLRRLDALPNPPAVPESSTRAMPNVETPLTPEQRDAMNEMIQASPFGQRPRAATPTPEVPPYAKQDGTRRAALTRLHEGLAPLPTGALASNEPVPEVPALKSIPGLPMMPLALQQAIQARKAEVPEPTAPEVVWSGDGVRVLADGTCEEEWPVPRGWAVVTDDRAMVSLARALAEAKRETGILKAAAEGQLKTTNAAERANAELAWGVAGSMQSALRRERSLRQEANRETRIAQVKADASYAKGREDGAESMRDRAKALIMAEQAKQEDGPLSDDNGHAFRLLLRLADAIGTLPLEES